MREIDGVKISLETMNPKSWYIKAEFSLERWKKIPELTDKGINVFFEQFVPEYFHKNEIDNANRIIWSPLVYNYKVYTNLDKYKYHELPESLQMLHNVCGGFRCIAAASIPFRAVVWVSNTIWRTFWVKKQQKTTYCYAT